jgi:hypothetical protein
MNDPKRVGLLERAANLTENVPKLRRGDFTETLEALSQVLAVEQLRFYRVSDLELVGWGIR